MTDYKNNQPKEPITKEDIFAGVIFFVAVFGGWLILNLI